MPATGFYAARGNHATKLIEKIESSIIWPGRIKGKTWFHPRACMIPATGNPVTLMTCQSITGSDVFGQVYWSRSANNGKSWTQPQPIISLGRRQLSRNIEKGVCDVVPDFHSKSNSVLAIGHNVYYKDNVLTQPYENRFFMTTRAEDGFGYVSASDDGLLWEKKQQWCWDDGEPLTMSTTQQHWISHSQGLFLVYTRKSANNINVMRWRAPLYIAQVDTDKLFLIRETEQIVFPLIGDGINDPDHVARMGNFHSVNASRRETWITVGETLPLEDWKGNTLLGRIYWNQSNELVHF